jgi:hypothetical protein
MPDWWKFFACVLVASAAVGCTAGAPRRAYTGTVRPAAEIATVEGAFVDQMIEGGGSMVALRAIDGQPRLGGWNGEALAQVELLPGEHLLGVEYHSTSGGGFLVPAAGRGIRENVEMRLEPGRRYVVYYSRDDGAFFVGELPRDDRLAVGTPPGNGVRCVPSSPTRARCGPSEATEQ